MAGSTVVPVEAFIVCRSEADAVTSTTVVSEPTTILKLAVVWVPTLTTTLWISSFENPGLDDEMLYVDG
jgi:hypothetical protein